MSIQLIFTGIAKLPKTKQIIYSFIFESVFSIGKLTGSAATGGSGTPRGFQQPQVVLLTPLRGVTKPSRRCSQDFWSLADPGDKNQNKIFDCIFRQQVTIPLLLDIFRQLYLIVFSSFILFFQQSKSRSFRVMKRWERRQKQTVYFVDS